MANMLGAVRGTKVKITWFVPSESPLKTYFLADIINQAHKYLWLLLIRKRCREVSSLRMWENMPVIDVQRKLLEECSICRKLKDVK